VNIYTKKLARECWRVITGGLLLASPFQFNPSRGFREASLFPGKPYPPGRVVHPAMACDFRQNGSEFLREDKFWLPEIHPVTSY
jgi:hypothetical protein